MTNFDSNMQFRLSTMIDDKMSELANALVHTEVGTPSHTEIWEELTLFRALGDMSYELQDKDKRIEELESRLSRLGDRRKEHDQFYKDYIL